MKWTDKKLKEKVWGIISAEKATGYGVQNRALFELPIGTKIWSDYYWNDNTFTDDRTYVLDTSVKIRLYTIDENGIRGYTPHQSHKFGTKEKPAYGSYILLPWSEIVKQPKVLKIITEWLEKVTPQFKATKDKGVITFVNKKTKEKLHCDLGKQEFHRSYKKGKDRQVRYPAQFFKHVSGRALTKSLNDPNANTFNVLVDLVAQKYPTCRNFGTFLVKMFDHQHLEQYISAGVEFDFETPFSYTDFSKDIRAKLNEHKIKYTQDVGSLFCSDKDTGRAVFAQIKDCKGFAKMVEVLSYNIQPLNTLVNHYNYDLKTLFAYARKNVWQTTYTDYYGRPRELQPNPELIIDATPDNYYRYAYVSNYNLISMLRDYSRMALDVFGENYDKYPEDLYTAHNEVTRVHALRAQEFNAKKFEELIDKSLEWKNKEFAVVYPKTATDVIEEGKRLRHCVGSYIQSVVNGECKIVFLRQKDDLEKPFVTIEISGGNIRQARGVGNSSPTYDARMALKDYAKEKKLLYRG